MKFNILTTANAAAALKLFNDACNGSMVHKPMELDAFTEKFLLPDTASTKIGLIAEDNSAFVAGCYIKSETPKAYITMIVVKDDCRRNGLGRQILAQLEKILRSESGVKAIDLSFFNPQTLEWIVPATNGHDHPNTPGIDVSSASYMFFKNCGYRDGSYQNSYYIDLAAYAYPADIEKYKQRLHDAKINVEYYNKDIHTGLEDFIHSLNNEIWNRDILGEMEKPTPRPLLIASAEGKACGFTGPLDVQPSGRGYFAGIGVHEDYRGCGAAKVLFSTLCMSLKDTGARFMTLFTGEANPARNIYEAAGFKIVHTWATMKKEFRD